MQARMEKIGNVVLDYTYYEGQDFYTDGEIEDEMLDIAMNNPPERFPEIIEERKSWPVFYHSHRCAQISSIGCPSKDR